MAPHWQVTCQVLEITWQLPVAASLSFAVRGLVATSPRLGVAGVAPEALHRRWNRPGLFGCSAE